MAKITKLQEEIQKDERITAKERKRERDREKEQNIVKRAKQKSKQHVVSNNNIEQKS